MAAGWLCEAKSLDRETNRDAVAEPTKGNEDNKFKMMRARCHDR
jgi:hypothetical protein